MLFIYILSYLSGSIPFGVLISKHIGNINIKEVGSGNIGATNVARAMGRKWAIITFLMDGLKGLIPVMFAKIIFADGYQTGIVALLCVVGHIFPVWLSFKGGKGVSTTILILFGLNWILGLLTVFVWLVSYKITKISAMGAICAMCSMSVLSIFFLSSFISFTCFLITGIILFKHRENIQRIISGKELSFKKKD